MSAQRSIIRLIGCEEAISTIQAMYVSPDRAIEVRQAPGLGLDINQKRWLATEF